MWGCWVDRSYDLRQSIYLQGGKFILLAMSVSCCSRMEDGVDMGYHCTYFEGKLEDLAALGSN